MDYKGKILDTGGNYEGLGQVNDTRQLNSTRQIHRMTIQDGTIKVKKWTNMSLCVQLYATLDVV